LVLSACFFLSRLFSSGLTRISTGDFGERGTHLKEWGFHEDYNLFDEKRRPSGNRAQRYRLFNNGEERGETRREFVVF